jgi:competence protein ComEC
MAASGLPSDPRGVLPGLVDGDTSLLEPDLADAFEKAGLTHLMAVSGENLSLILGAVLGFGRIAGFGRRAGPLLAGAAVIGFVIVARPSPSVLRATVMGAIALVAIVSGRERQGVPALCAAVLVLVLIDPELARSYGFALSALATAGILVLAPAWCERLSKRMPRRLAEPLAVSAAAHAACAPVLAMLGAGVSLIAIPANLFAAPAVGPATLLGVFAAMVAPMVLRGSAVRRDRLARWSRRCRTAARRRRRGRDRATPAPAPQDRRRRAGRYRGDRDRPAAPRAELATARLAVRHLRRGPGRRAGVVRG